MDASESLRHKGIAEPLTAIARLLEQGDTESRLAAIARARWLIDRVAEEDRGIGARARSLLLGHLHDEREPRVRAAIGEALFGPVTWELRYGSPLERKRAAERLVLLEENQSIELIERLSAALSEQMKKEARKDLRRTMRAALIAVQAGSKSGRKPSRLIILGAIVKTVRERARLSRSELCAKSGVLKDTLGYIERAYRQEPLSNYLKVLRALAGQVRDEEAATFYEQWSPELARLPWYDPVKHVYRCTLREGVTLEQALATSLPRLLRRRQEELALGGGELARSSRLQARRVWDLINGRIKRPALSMLAPLAAALEVDASLLYLLAHREISSFVEVRVAGAAGGYRHPREVRFERTVIESVNRPDARFAVRKEILQRLGLDPRAHYCSAIARYVRYDDRNREAYVALPSEGALRAAEELDLRRRLAAAVRARGVSRRSSKAARSALRRFATWRGGPRFRRCGTCGS